MKKVSATGMKPFFNKRQITREIYKMTIIRACSFLMVFFAVTANAGDIIEFQAGEPISASEMNQNFSELDARTSTASPNSKLVVFSSSTTVAGTAGRVAMNAACETDDPAASFCPIERLQAAYKSSGITFGALSAQSWVDTIEAASIYNSFSLPDQPISYIPNCQGWTNSSTGRVLLQNGKFDSYSCANSTAALCCK
jgi:hypothetical protein